MAHHPPSRRPRQGTESDHDAIQRMRLITAPFAEWNPEKMDTEITSFINEAGLEDDRPYIYRGAKLAQDKKAFERGDSELEYREAKDEEHYLHKEKDYNSRFDQSWGLYSLVILCSIGAAVQGWDESAVSSAQIYYQYAFDIQGSNILGLINAAPYLCCVVSCWLNYPMNKFFGRRGTIFISCCISFITCLGQGFAQTWEQLFVARLLLGLGIGPKSATIPVFAAECAPANIRGALVMMWQMWTAAGIMFGYIAGVALHTVSDGASKDCYALGNYTYAGSQRAINQTLPPDVKGYSILGVTNSDVLIRANCSLNWRMMLAAPMIFPLFVVAYIYSVPESPRWLLQKAQAAKEGDMSKRKYYQAAWSSMCKLRHTKLQAARDLFLIHHLLKNEESIMKQRKPLRELFTQPRNRRAITASVIVMFLQQFCGVNIHVYYSVSVFYEQARFSTRGALLAGMGFGIINFLFAIPAVWTIDTIGRRNLLLSTFPFMAIFQAFIAIALAADATQSLLLVGMYLFAVAYSPGEGPVPFVYSAESMPLYNRDLGMGIVTAVLWLFNGILAITYPQFLKAFQPWGTFTWYAGWCAGGWFLILLFVPETKDLSLEELDAVFSLRTSTHMAHGGKQFKYFIQRFILRRNFVKRPVLPHVLERDHGFESPESASEVGISDARYSRESHEMADIHISRSK